MATELGIGVRVWVGWCPDGETTAIFDGRCKTGTIDGGPWFPGDFVRDGYTGEIRIVAGTYARWNISLDAGGRINSREDAIFPIDDGDPAAERERADRGEEVEA